MAADERDSRDRGTGEILSRFFMLERGGIAEIVRGGKADQDCEMAWRCEHGAEDDPWIRGRKWVRVTRRSRLSARADAGILNDDDGVGGAAEAIIQAAAKDLSTGG